MDSADSFDIMAEEAVEDVFISAAKIFNVRRKTHCVKEKLKSSTLIF